MFHCSLSMEINAYIVGLAYEYATLLHIIAAILSRQKLINTCPFIVISSIIINFLLYLMIMKFQKTDHYY